jgi:hypothetical protein
MCSKKTIANKTAQFITWNKLRCYLVVNLAEKQFKPPQFPFQLKLDNQYILLPHPSQSCFPI